MFLAFHSMAAGDIHSLQATLLLPLEHLCEVRRRVISRTHIPAILGGLLSKNEAGQLATCPQSTHTQRERCLRLSKNRGRHRFSRLIHPESHLFISKWSRLVTHLANFFESFRFSWEQREPFWLTRHGPEQVSWHSLAGHSPLQRWYQQLKSLPPPPSFLLLCL